MKSSKAFYLLALFIFLFYPAASQQNQARFPGSWGVLAHFLNGKENDKKDDAEESKEWNKRVNDFDVDKLADQLASVNAKYFFITIGQNSGFFLSPNKTYDSIVGRQPSWCSRRDLVLDLSRALSKRDIKLGIYITSNAPEHDLLAVSKFKWKKGNFRLEEFQRMWEAVIREWSLRWGKNVFAWWVDHVYFAEAMYMHDEAPNFSTLKAAITAGNPDALVSFNTGVKSEVSKTCAEEDFTAGEFDYVLPLCSTTAPYGKKNRNMREGVGEQVHVLTFMGSMWNTGAPRMPDQLVLGITQHIVDNGGVVTWDVPISPSGELREPFIQQLKILSTLNQKQN